MTTTESATGVPPLPSMSVPPSTTRADCCGACADTIDTASATPNNARDTNAFTGASPRLASAAEALSPEPLRGELTLNSLEILLDLSPRNPQHHGAAVRANRGIGGAAQLLENVRHLFVRERVIGFDRRMARGRRGDSLDRRVHAGAAIEPFQILRQRPQSSRTILASEQRRACRHPDGFAAEFLQLESEALEIGRVRRQRLSRRGWKIHEHRNEQSLTFQRSAQEPFRDALEQHALVGDSLIDDTK